MKSLIKSSLIGIQQYRINICSFESLSTEGIGTTPCINILFIGSPSPSNHVIFSEFIYCHCVGLLNRYGTSTLSWQRRAGRCQVFNSPTKIRRRVQVRPVSPRENLPKENEGPRSPAKIPEGSWR